MDRQMERYSDQARYNLNFEQGYLRQSSIRDENQFRSVDDQSPRSFLDNNYQRRGKKCLQNDEINLLHDKKRSLQNFMDTIGDFALQPIRSDILDHCEKVSVNIPTNLTKAVIIKLVKNRVDKMIKNKRIKKNWSEQDINILIWVISKYCQFYGISNPRDQITEADWTNIANLIPGVTGKSCMFKWLSLKKSNLAENSWLEDQSLLLDAMVKKYGEDNWCKISQELYLNNTQSIKVYRCPKQCREHWNCYLNPKLKKGPWQKKQDYLLLRAVKQLQGVKKWAQIVKMFNGRTQNALKNRFTLIIQKQSKQLRNKKKYSELQLVQHFLKKHQNQQIDEHKLKFLSEKRQLITQNQLRKKPKKLHSFPSVLVSKKVKEEEYYSQSEEYIPEQPMIKVDKRTTRNKVRSRQLKGLADSRYRSIDNQDQEDARYLDNAKSVYDREQSYNKQIQIKKQDPIFQEDDQINLNVNSNMNPMGYPSNTGAIYHQNPIMGQFGCQNQLKNEQKPFKQSYRLHIRNSALSLPSLPLSLSPVNNQYSNDEHTNTNSNQQNLTIQSYGINIVPLTKQIMQTYMDKKMLIPCRITESNNAYNITMFKK